MSGTLIYALSVRPFSMEDEETRDRNNGKALKGFSLWFVNEYVDPQGVVIGNQPQKITIAEHMEKEVLSKTFPAICEIDVGVKPGQGGKSTAVLNGIKHIGGLPITKIYQAAGIQIQPK